MTDTQDRDQDVLRRYLEDGSGCRRLLIFFGGLWTFGLPRFEFCSILAKLDIQVHVLFVRDRQQSWYFRGCKGVSSCISSTLQFLQQEAWVRGMRARAAAQYL